MFVLPAQDIIDRLRKNPGDVYVSGSGKELYVSHPAGIFVLTGPDFKQMNEEQINAYIQVTFSR